MDISPEAALYYKATARATERERLRCASTLCEGCRQHGKPLWRTGNPGPDKYAQHPPYDVEVLGQSVTQVSCHAEQVWEIEK